MVIASSRLVLPKVPGREVWNMQTTGFVIERFKTIFCIIENFNAISANVKITVYSLPTVDVHLSFLVTTSPLLLGCTPSYSTMWLASYHPHNDSPPIVPTYRAIGAGPSLWIGASDNEALSQISTAHHGSPQLRTTNEKRKCRVPRFVSYNQAVLPDKIPTSLH